ncbi:MAG: DMT family transporter [Dongiaceae bacterium]
MNPGLWGAVTAFCWGGSDFTARFTSTRIGYIGSLLGTLLGGVILLSLIVLAMGSLPDWPAVPWVLVAASGLGLMFGSLWLYLALARGPISVAAPVAGSFPALVVLGAVLLGHRPGALQWAGMALVFVGGVAIARSAEAHAEEEAPARGHRSLAGLRLTVLIALSSAVAFSGSVIAAQQLVPVIGQLHTTWLTRMVALVLLLLLIAARRAWPAAPRKLLPVLALQASLDTFGYLALFTGSVGPDAHIAAVTSAGYGAVTAILARLFLREPVGVLQWLGIAVLTAGVTLLSA